MQGTDWLALELIRGVSDAELQKKLLLEQDPALHRLVRIAEQSRSDLKNPNHFNFSSFFGDFCLKVFGKEVNDYLS